LKIIYFGSPEYSKIVLQSLVDSSNEVVSVVTQDIKSTKRNKNKKTPVGVFSESISIETHYPKILNDDAWIKRIEDYKPDLAIIFSYGKILPDVLLKIPSYGALNIHCSELPKWRGASPIQRAILNGDANIGLTFFMMDSKIDTGKIVEMKKIDMEDSDNCITLQEKLANLAAHEVLNVVDSIENGCHTRDQGTTNISYAKKIKKDEGKIKWTDNCLEISRKVRAFIEWPVVEAVLFDQIIKIYDVDFEITNDNYQPGQVISLDSEYLSIRAGDGVIKIKKLQLPGSKLISARDLNNSNSVFSMKLKNF